MILLTYTVEAVVSGHPRDGGHPRNGGYPRVAKKVSVTGAGRLWECQNTVFVWELRKTGFCEGGRK